jgi:hypothetical protein
MCHSEARPTDVSGNSHGFSANLGVIWFDRTIQTGRKADPDTADYWTKYPMKLITVNEDPGGLFVFSE